MAKSRAYVGIDGFLLPMVTDAEMLKRFEKAKANRKTRKRRKGVRRRRLVCRRGADQRYKEMKMVTIYDQEKNNRLVRATRGGVQQTGRMLRQMSADVHLKRADQIAAVADGAEWISRLVDQNLPKPQTTVILDYFHASQHVHQARRTLFGEDDAKGNAWAEQVLGALGQSWDPCWELLMKTRSQIRGKSKRKALDELMRYLLTRRQKTDYANFRAAGYDIGSGPTESMCKSLSRRLKGIGMRWKPENAEAMTALEALHQSNLWNRYWSTRLAA